MLSQVYFGIKVFNQEIGCKSITGQNLFREGLKEIAGLIFTKLEETRLTIDNLGVACAVSTTLIEANPRGSKTTRDSESLEKRHSTNFRPFSTATENSPDEIPACFQRSRIKSALNSEQVSEEFILRNYIARLTTHIVDEVCLYSEKVHYLEQCCEEMNLSPLALQDRINIEKSHVSIRSVEPESSGGDEDKYHKIIPVLLKNELGIDSGKYGW